MICLNGMKTINIMVNTKKIHSYECIFIFIYFFIYIFLQSHYYIYNYNVKRNTKSNTKVLHIELYL